LTWKGFGGAESGELLITYNDKRRSDEGALPSYLLL